MLSKPSTRIVNQPLVAIFTDSMLQVNCGLFTAEIDPEFMQASMAY
jgi:hypothetical protein